jgi:hypothetical protein
MRGEPAVWQQRRESLYPSGKGVWMQASVSLSRRLDKPTLLIGLLVVWIGLWFLPWQALLKPLPAIAVLIALVMYIIPGALLQQLAWPDRTFDPLRAITVGFVLSVALTAILGLIALVFHLSIGFLLGSLFWISTVMLALLIRRGWRAPVEAQPRSWVNTFLMALALVTMALTAALTFSRSAYDHRISDDVTYDAYAQAYAYGDQLGFEEVYFGTQALSSARFWLALWPMSQAVILRLSDVHILTLNPLLKAYFVVLALLNLYELARAFKLPTSIAWLTVIGQVAWLDSTWGIIRYGLTTINQDKRLLALLIAPVIFRLLVELFRDRRFLKLFATACLGAVLTHSTLFALTALICGIYCVGEMLLFRHYRTAFRVIGVLAVCIGLLLPLRFIERSYVFRVASEDAIGESHAWEVRMNRLTTIEGTPFYGLSFQSLYIKQFLMVYVSSFCALFFLRRSAAARFIVSVMLLTLIEMFPYTGWLIGLGITPYHLWRIQWLIPIGIGWAFLIMLFVSLLSRLVPAGRRAQRLKGAALAAVGAASLIVVLVSSLQDDAVRIQLRHIAQGEGPRTGYETLVQLGEFLDSQLPVPSVVIANSNLLSSTIPGLSANAKTLVFRTLTTADRQTQVDANALNARYDVFNRFWDAELSETRIEIMNAYAIRLVVTEGNERVMAQMMEDYPNQIVQIARIGRFRVYQYR